MSVTILCYHKVGSLEDEGRSLNVRPSTLKSHISYFARKGLLFVTAGELAGEWPSAAACFTFDDAYSSALEHAVDLLGQFGERGTFYAVPEFVGLASSWDGERARPLAKWDTLRSAQSAGHEIGNHTLTHPKLDELADADVEREIQGAHDRLVEEGLHPGSVCYPYGAYDDRSLKAAEQAGYKVGMAVRPIAASPLLALPRVIVAYSDSLPLLLYKLNLRPLLRRTRALQKP